MNDDNNAFTMVMMIMTTIMSTIMILLKIIHYDDVNNIDEYKYVYDNDDHQDDDIIL